MRVYLAMVAQTHGDPPLHPILRMATSSVLVFTPSLLTVQKKCDFRGGSDP